MKELGRKKYYAALLTFSGMLLAFLLVGGVTLNALQRSLFDGEASRLAAQELALVERFTRDALLRHDYSLVEDVLVEWGRRDEHVLRVRAVTHNGYVLASYEGGQSGGPTLQASSTIDLGGTESVVLEILKDRGHYYRVLDRFIERQILWSLLLTLLFGIALWQTLRRLALVPMQKEIQRRREAETSLTRARDELEERVIERTRQLQEREQQVELLLNSTAEAIFGLDTQGNCTFVNPACVKTLGYDTAEALLGKSMHEVMHHSRRDGSTYRDRECPIYQAFRNNEGSHGDDEVLWRADGTSFDAEYWSYPIHSEGKLIGSVVTFIDISDRKRTEQELRHYRENLEKEVQNRTHQLQNAIDLMSGREARMAELKEVIRALRTQIEAEGLRPCADDPMVGGGRND